MTFAMKDFRPVVKEWMLRELQAHGFRPRGKEVYRKIPGGTQTFSYETVERLPFYVQIGFFVDIRIEHVAVLAAELNEKRLTDAATLSFQLHDIETALISRESTHQGTEIHTLVELEEHLNYLGPIVRNKVIPLFDRVQNVFEGANAMPISVERIANPQGVLDHFGRLFAIVYLSGGDWEPLVREATPLLEKRPDWNTGSAMRSMWDKVVCNLRKLPPRPKK